MYHSVTQTTSPWWTSSICRKQYNWSQILNRPSAHWTARSQCVCGVSVSVIRLCHLLFQQVMD